MFLLVNLFAFFNSQCRTKNKNSNHPVATHSASIKFGEFNLFMIKKKFHPPLNKSTPGPSSEKKRNTLRIILNVSYQMTNKECWNSKINWMARKSIMPWWPRYLYTFIFSTSIEWFTSWKNYSDYKIVDRKM